MAFTISDDIERKIKLKKKALSRKQIKKQLSRNGYGKYTSIEMDMLISEAWVSMSGSCKDLMMYFLMKRKLRFEKGKVPICLNPDEIHMTWKEFLNQPFNWSSEKFRRSKKTLLVRGFMKLVYQGGKYKKDKNIYGISDNWRIWKKGMDFSLKGKDVKRGYQGKNLGAIKTKLAHKIERDTRTRN